MISLLSTAYFGPIQYFSKISSAEKIFLEQHEHYPKQTYRNRCEIYGANGPITLTVPVTKGDALKIYTRDVRIDHSTPWQKIHTKTLESAYKNSPFFDYYADDILPLILKKHHFLIDLNLEILHSLCELLTLTTPFILTEEYIKTVPQGWTDHRDSIHPKIRMYKEDPDFTAPVYLQVFETKHGFYENLSILDLLFNTGPDATNLLELSGKN